MEINATGFWVDTQGNRLTSDMRTFLSLAAIGRVLTERLRRQGADASVGLPPDFSERFNRGQYTGAPSGHGGSVKDPDDTLPLSQSASVALPGGHRHRIPANTTYRTNYPTEQNPYGASAPFHLTFAMVLWNLQPTQ